MKNRSFIFGSLFALVALSGGCTKNFERYNTDPEGIYKVPLSAELEAMIQPMMYTASNTSQYVDMMVGSYGGYFSAINRWGGSEFDMFNPTDSNNAIPWDDAFTTTYSNFFSIEQRTEGAGHWYTLAKLVRAATMMRIADMYGPIPYSKVKFGHLYVEYDSAEDVYAHIIEDLQEAVAELELFSINNPGFRPFTRDPTLYKGDYTMWARYANSLILRAAMRIGDRSTFESTILNSMGVIELNAQNCIKDQLESFGNPYWRCAIGYGDWRVGSSIVDYMNGYGDPRRASYFNLATQSGHTTEYIGARTGVSATTKGNGSGYSEPNIDRYTTPVGVFYAAETKFLLAEAALKGWSVPGTAKENYEAGITLSMEQNGVQSTATATYIADATSVPADHTGDFRSGHDYDRATQVKIAWTDSDPSNLEQIITQKWIANYPMGLEAWADFRRTGFPELAPSLNNQNPTVVTNTARGARRLAYPFSERNLNDDWYNAAVGSLLGGADDQATELFWAKTN